MDLAKENASLRKQLELLAEARNQEVLDLQHHFAQRIKELEKLKGLDRSAEIEALNAKIIELEGDRVKQKEENIQLTQTVKELERKLKEAEQSKEDMSYALERARIQAMQAAAKPPPPPQPEINIDEIFASFEEQMAELADVIAQKQEEINRLQKLVHDECQERVKLQTILGLTPKAAVE